MSRNVHPVIDLFCGAGGFSLGAHLGGLSVALAVDKDATLTSCYRQNFPSSKLLLEDVSLLTGSRLLREAGLEKGSEFGIIGGPPCQGFSLIGKRDLSDPRNSLVGHFFRLVEETQPAFFIMENVPGILAGDSFALLKESYAGLKNYSICPPQILNASEFGAATDRDRVVLIGIRGSKPFSLPLLAKMKVQTKPSVRSAIADLPGPEESGEARYRSQVNYSEYAVAARTLAKGLGSEHARIRLLAGKVSGVKPTVHSEDVVLRFSSVKEGRNDIISRCPRLCWEGLAPTLRAGTGPDHGSFQSVRPIHPSESRVITVREAARLQGFPDWFDFHSTKWHSFRMIGNSVSPKVSFALASAITDHLKSARGDN